MWKALIPMFVGIGILASPVFFFSQPKQQWTILDAHHFANETAVTIGDWCSGTVIDAKRGLVVTASHCVKKLKTVKARDGETEYGAVNVTLTKTDDYGAVSDRHVFAATVIGDEPDHDIAILKVSKPGAFSIGAKISTVPLKFGDRVFTVGHPLMFQTVVAEGNVSEPQVNIRPDNDERELTTILFTARMNHGSSGGALYNSTGELIGVTNWETDGGDYFASPATNIIALLKDIGLNSED